ncbi:exodeoxyribonuclease VII large subunit [Hymenobacter siberiensis]|uniref:exodeoxyribonuclease VII large subunit n=1 Tax=Hymenobacter siberiensis TaxID=2848396 RepID=UPI001C1E5379|nr:exodeoxyribonuclease VII large subunit [Hymenobacter siberiensis]MBU6122755.1 exodeoxyribonuclease VII large subunit [Hymenobacter siberiensis]
MPLYNRRSELAPPPAPAPLGLAELLGYVRLALQQQLADSYWVVAEVSDLTLPRFAGAHCYLTLTEQTIDGRGTPLKAQARATLWSQRYQQLAPTFERATGQPLRTGLKLLLRVQVRFHEQYGLNLDVVAIDPSYTVGELALLRLKTLRLLEEKGLLERQKQLMLPLAPQRLAVISSPTAAGFQDFVQQLQEAPYDFALTLFPAIMQGDGSPASIRAALDGVRARRGQFDAVVLIRGGGSRTDLLAFDEYGLAAAVGAFPLPVLTGIGHERDEALVDLTAHRALKTPTAVAAFLVERLAHLEAAVLGLGEQVVAVARRQLSQGHARLDQLSGRSRYAAHRQLDAAREALRARAHQATLAPREQLRQLAVGLGRFRHQLPRAARRTLAREQRGLRQRGRVLLRRFGRHHQRRREALLRQRYQLQLAVERQLHRAELRLCRLAPASAPSVVGKASGTPSPHQPGT